jgi:RNA polymerase sigma-70 factor (ECF subfamily)
MLDMDNLSKKVDKELVELLMAGSQQAFEELYIRYKDRLMYFCKRILKDQTKSEDIVHDIFLQLLEKNESLNPELSFWGYLQKLAQNRILDEFRRFDIYSRFAQYIIMNGKDSTIQTESSILDHDYTKLLNELIESLSPKQKEIFQLSRIQGLTYKEIAELKHVSVETVREHAYFALKKIKKYLMQHADLHFKTVITLLMFLL